MVAAGENARVIDATLLFADVAGFTALNERLLRRGREGAELLTNLLDAVFGRMIAEAEELGGDLLSFGGDALLLCFDGADHLGRATTTAERLQQVLSDRTPAHRAIGRVELGMSMGLASGPVVLLNCGDTSAQLVVLGPTVDGVLAAEATAVGGEIRHGTPTAFPEALRARRLPRPVRRTTATTGDRVEQPVLIDPNLSEFVTLNPSAAEHRLVTSVFVRITATLDQTAWSPSGLRRLHRHLTDLTARIQHLASRHGLTLVTFDPATGGGKFLLVSGAPSAQGEPVDRACDFAVDLQAALASATTIGINHGTVFCGEIGSGTRRVYAVIGDAVNTAARVMAHGTTGETWLTATTVPVARHVLPVSPVPPFAAKGKAAPIVAVRLDGHTQRHRSIRAHQTPGTARELELTQLSRHRAAANRKRRVVTIVEEPGTGKSQLLAEFLDRDAGQQLLVVGGRYARHTAYRSLGDGLASWLGSDLANPRDLESRLHDRVRERAPQLEPWIPLLGLPLGLELSPTPAVAALDAPFVEPSVQRVWKELLSAGGTMPVVAVDDAQWLDAETLSFLVELCRWDRPGLVLIAGRSLPDDLADVPQHRLDVNPLNRAQATALIRSVAGVPVPPWRIREIVELAQGNPLFLAALAVARLDESLPTTIEDTLRGSYDRHLPDTRRALGGAAVAGSRAPLAIVAQALNHSLREQTGPPLAVALGCAPDFVELDHAEVRFVHSLRREVVYESLPHGVRRRLHSAVADAYAATAERPAPELLAIHYAASARHREAFEASVAAAEQTEAHGSLTSAAEHLRRAAALQLRVRGTAELPRWELLTRLGRVEEALGQFAAARRHLLAAFRAARLASAAERREIAVQLAALTRVTGDLRGARRWCDRADQLPDDHDPATRADVVRERGAIEFRAGNLERSLDLHRRAAALAGDTRPDVQAQCLMVIGSINEMLGTGGLRELRSAAATFRRLGNRRSASFVLNNLGAAYYDRGRWDDALDCYDRAAQAAEELGDLVQAATARNNMAEIHSDRGDFGVARDLLTDALEVWRGAEYHLGVGVALGNLCRVERRAGQFQLSARHLHDAVEAFRRVGDQYFLDDMRTRAVALALATGDDRQITLEATDMERLANDPAAGAVLQATAARLLALVSLRRGDTATAHAHIDHAIRTARQGRASYELLLALEVARLSGVDTSERNRRRLATLVARLGITETGQAALLSAPVVSATTNPAVT
jgi:class 3 adenylate cyclase/tetratricopeptide (TPR) repeat protein